MKIFIDFLLTMSLTLLAPITIVLLVYILYKIKPIHQFKKLLTGYDLDSMVNKRIFVDIDDTVFYYKRGTSKLDYTSAKPNYRAIKRVNKLYDRGNHITYYTARGAEMEHDFTELTRAQLEACGAKYDKLRLDKPLYDVFLDDRTINPRVWF